MKKLVNSFLPADQQIKVGDGLGAAIGVIEPFGISLNNEQRVGIRTMSDGREGVARTICRTSLEFITCLPRNEDPAELKASLDYFDELASMRVKAARVLEIIDDTAVALGVDIMAMADRYAGHLQTARTGNTSLDAALQPVDEYNRRFANREETGGDTPDTPAAS